MSPKQFVTGISALFKFTSFVSSTPGLDGTARRAEEGCSGNKKNQTQLQCSIKAPVFIPNNRNVKITS
jgi:hypothetical protein